MYFNLSQLSIKGISFEIVDVDDDVGAIVVEFAVVVVVVVVVIVVVVLDDVLLG